MFKNVFLSIRSASRSNKSSLKFYRFGVASMFVFAASTAFAAPYEGVVPGSGHAAPVAPRSGSGRTVLTWPGFQKTAHGSRIFVQVTKECRYETRVKGRRVEIVLPRSKTHLRNTLLPLDTSYFETPIKQAQIKRRGKDLVLVIDLRREAQPEVSLTKGSNGYWFLYVDF